MIPPTAPHGHRWQGIAFFLEDGHPKYRMRCACGAERVIRAWERFWDPSVAGRGPPRDVAGTVASTGGSTPPLGRARSSGGPADLP